jgi:hypothetical protein
VQREVLMFLVWKLRFQVRMVIVAMRIVSHQPSLLLLMKVVHNPFNAHPLLLYCYSLTWW